MTPNTYITKTVIILILINIYCQAAAGQSIYTEEINIPKYDPLNIEHFLISSTKDWTHINDSDKRFFYVEPNQNYGTIEIHTDGTVDKRRFISLYNGNDIHPAKLDWTERANVRLVFDSAHFWIVDRMSSINFDKKICYIIRNHSTNIVLNRLHLTGFYSGIRILGPSVPPYTENITVQNSRFDKMTKVGIDADRGAILLSGDCWKDDITILNTKILNNELKNCNDGIALFSHPEVAHEVSYPGTIIDNNHIYVDFEVYTDGKGNHIKSGKRALTENAVDLKGGSEDPEHPVIISNNYFWGYRKTDQNGGGSGSHGPAIVGHYHVKNLEFNNNIVFNSNRGIVFSDPAGLPFSVENAYIYGNIFFNIGFDPEGKIEYANFAYHSKNVRFQKNTIVGINKQSRWFNLYGDEQELDVSYNIIIDSYKMGGKRNLSTKVAFNTFYNTEKQRLNDGKYYINAPSLHMSDLTFTTDRYTNEPRKITLYRAISAEFFQLKNHDTDTMR